MVYEICIYFVFGAAALRMFEARLKAFCEQMDLKHVYKFRT